MRILVACEFSGRVRDAFTRNGHFALSCDLLPAKTPGEHYQGPVEDILDGWFIGEEGIRGLPGHRYVLLTKKEPWDMMIAHPPCTHLTISGAQYWKEKRLDGRQSEALDFIRLLLDAPIPKICLENPIGLISTYIRKPSQIIEPYQFGDPHKKATCLWLKGLPHLRLTNVAGPRKIVDGKPRYYNQTDEGRCPMANTPDRGQKRSITYSGIAEAMADQWG